MKKRDKPKTTPFSPALADLIESISLDASRKVVAALEREAQHLQLPKGTTFNVQKREWQLP